MLSLTLQFQHCRPLSHAAPGPKRWQSTPPSKALDAFGGVCLAYAARCRALDLEQTLKQVEPLQQLGGPDAAAGGRGPSRPGSTTHPQSILQHLRRSSGRRFPVLYLRLIWPRQDQKDVRYTNRVSG